MKTEHSLVNTEEFPLLHNVKGARIEQMNAFILSQSALFTLSLLAFIFHFESEGKFGDGRVFPACYHKNNTF